VGIYNLRNICRPILFVFLLFAEKGESHEHATSLSLAHTTRHHTQHHTPKVSLTLFFWLCCGGNNYMIEVLHTHLPEYPQWQAPALPLPHPSSRFFAFGGGRCLIEKNMSGSRPGHCTPWVLYEWMTAMPLFIASGSGSCWSAFFLSPALKKI